MREQSASKASGSLENLCKDPLHQRNKQNNQLRTPGTNFQTKYMAGVENLVKAAKTLLDASVPFQQWFKNAKQTRLPITGLTFENAISLRVT